MKESHLRKGRIKKYRARRYGYESGKNKRRQQQEFVVDKKGKRMIFFAKRGAEREENG